MRSSKQWIWIVLVLVVAALPLAGCSDSATEAASDDDPAEVEPIKGSDLNRVLLSQKAVERLGVETVPVRVDRAQRKVIPYAAVLYQENGRTFTYTSPKPRVFVRRPISVERIKGNLALLSHGPPSGTAVVTVGGQELYGVEYEVEED